MEAFILLVVLFIVYWAPTGIAAYRKLDNVFQIAVLNFFAFIGIAWVVALVWAFKPTDSVRDPKHKHNPQEWSNRG